jgi:A/G-specific adenine glycosylase
VKEEFSKKLVEWYSLNKRDLPWRNINDPYKIWLSEVILQQTRVAQGTKYYLSFVHNYPTVSKLAVASENKVLKLWQGLGYYSRARNLHYTAKVIVDEYNGKFPSEYSSLIKLKGIGEYSASAIASFAFNLPYPVIDGNVYRVLSRIYGVDSPIDLVVSKKIFFELANLLLDKKNPAEHNQAIMEFGALQCVPVSPNCEICIFKSRCFAFGKNKVKDLPVKAKKIKQKVRHLNYFDFSDGDKTIITKRKEKDIWEGLYQYPLIETKKASNWNEIIGKNEIFSSIERIKLKQVSKNYKHQLTHQTIYAKFWKVEGIFSRKKMDKQYKIISKNNLIKYPVPKLIELYLQL